MSLIKIGSVCLVLTAVTGGTLIAKRKELWSSKSSNENVKNKPNPVNNDPKVADSPATIEDVPKAEDDLQEEN